MSSNNIQWHKLADHINLLPWQPNNLCVVSVAGKYITLARTSSDNIHACAHKCPHASGIMANGFIDALGNIVCPLHRYKFALSNGRNVSGEGYYLKTYRVEQQADGWYIAFEKKVILGW
ncbi:MAG: Rieske (2Fe-2S) protein [Chitinophagaceae bacterium]